MYKNNFFINSKVVSSAQLFVNQVQTACKCSTPRCLRAFSIPPHHAKEKKSSPSWDMAWSITFDDVALPILRLNDRNHCRHIVPFQIFFCCKLNHSEMFTGQSFCYFEYLSPKFPRRSVTSQWFLAAQDSYVKLKK